MKIKKSPLQITLICLVLVVAWSGIWHSFSVRSLSDGFFLLCLFFLIVGVAQWLLGTNFFDHFHYSMSKAMRHRKPRSKAFVPISKKIPKNYFIYLKTALFLFLLSIVCLLVEIYLR